jgi:hypothetical protein
MGVVQSVFVGTLGLGAVLAPAIISWLGVRGALIVTGLFLPLLAAIAWRPLRRVDVPLVAPAQNLALLSSIPIFRPLPPATLEQLASAAAPVHVAPGDAVVTQGEHGDRFYVVVSGELDVDVDGAPGTPLHAGDSFGEIALLRDAPRSATVRARTDSDLLTLDREEFLAAVTGNADSTAAARAVAAARLSALRPSLASV